MRGKIKWFNTQKGYGFLVPDSSDGSPEFDLFLHFREVERRPDEARLNLAEGELVEYEEGEDRRGRRCAVRVRRV